MTDTKEPEKKEEEKPMKLMKGVYTECGYCGKIHSCMIMCPELSKWSSYPECAYCGYIYNASKGCGCKGSINHCDCGRKVEKGDYTCSLWPMCDY